MDVKCVRVLRTYEDAQDTKKVIYVDEAARYSLIKQWGETVIVRGRRDVKDVVIKPLQALDKDGFIDRASQALIDELYIEYGEEVLLI
jgi:hypothetical protein